MKRLLFLLLIPTLGWGQGLMMPNHPGLELFSGGNRGIKALAASPVDSVGFTANWKAVTGGSSYKLDVATDLAFTSYVSGYQNKAVSGTSQAVTGLSWFTTYYYRVRVTKGSATLQSNTITTTTTLAAGYKYFLTSLSQYFKGSDSKFETVH